MSEPVLPSIAEMAANFTGAMARIALEGFEFVGEGQYSSRLAECQRCPQYRIILGLYHGCRLCGCSRLKLHFTTERCPLGKWTERRC